MSNKISFTKEISIIPTILALSGLVIACIQFFYQAEFNSESRVSYINARVDQFYDSKVKIVLGSDNFTPFIYRKRAKIILSNNGFHPASIVDWSFFLPFDLKIKNKKETMRAWVPGINPVLKTTEGKKFSFPLNINPGESKAFLVEYSVGIENEVYEQLPVNYKNNNLVDWRALEDKLFVIYGKETSYTEYLFELIKADGASLEFRFTNFGTSSHMQGEKQS